MEIENVNEFTITWRIENSSSLWNFFRYSDCLSSPNCTAENLEKRCFHLSLFCGGQNSVGELYLSFDLNSNIAGDESIPIESTIEIIDAGGDTLQSKTFSISPDKRRGILEWENIITIDELLNKMKNWTEDTLTVRCHIIGKVQTRQPKIECEAMTKIDFDRCSCLWNVKMPNTSNWSERRVFSFHEQSPIHITLSAPEDDILINIKSERETELFVHCRMSLVDLGGSERYSQIADYSFGYDDDEIWKFPTFFTKTILKDNKDTLLKSDAFALACNFTVPNGMHFEEVRYRTFSLINAPSTEDAVSSLLDDWRNMFSSKKHADVKLRVDKEIFPAHKSLLAARSPVFSAMFDQDMLESRTGIVDIDDLDVKTMNSFLEFMYTGTVEDMDYQIASKLLIAAEKYQVLSLKEECAFFLMSILSEENACEIITLSEMVRHEILKTSSLDYIKSHAKNILQFQQWLKWSEMNFKLATEIICMLSTNIATDKKCRK